MSYGISTALHAQCLQDFIDALAGGTLKIYAGARPATGGAAGAELVSVNFASPAGVVAADLLTFSGLGVSLATAAGVPTWARFAGSGGTFVCDADAGGIGSGADVEVALGAHGQIDVGGAVSISYLKIGTSPTEGVTAASLGIVRSTMAGIRSALTGRVTRASRGVVGATLAGIGSTLTASFAPGVSAAAPYMTVTWPAVSGASSYRLYYGGVRSGYYPTSINVGNVLTYTLGGLTQGTPYYYAVAAVDSGGVESQISYESSAMMPKAAQRKYVATTGNNNVGGGTIGSPWQTIQFAMTQANPGDTILVRAGTYVGKLTMTRSGSAGNWITFRPFDGESVTISTAGQTFGPYESGILFGGCSYVRFEKFTVIGTGSNQGAIGANSTFHHVHLCDMDISGSNGAGIFCERPNGSAIACQSIITGNHMHGNGNGGLTLYAGDGPGHIRVAYNTVHDNTSVSANFDGLQIGSQGGGWVRVVVKRNEVYNEGNTNGADLLDLGGHTINHHFLVEENYVHDPTGYGHFKCHSGDLLNNFYTAGISGFHLVRFNNFKSVLWDEYGTPNPIAAHNNTWYDSGIMMQMKAYDGNPANTSIGDTTYASWKASTGQADTDTGRFNIKNNLMFQNANGTKTIEAIPPVVTINYASQRWQWNMYRPTAGMTFDFYPDQYPLTAAGLVTLKANHSPSFQELNSSVISTAIASMFRNAASADWRLMSTSPARGAAGPLTRTLNTATGGGSTSLVVDRASWFCDGFPLNGELVTNPDVITIGGGAPVAIVSIVDSTNTITLAAARTWLIGDAVTLSGLTDIGAKQFVSDTQLAAPSKPTITSITPV